MSSAKPRPIPATVFWSRNIVCSCLRSVPVDINSAKRSSKGFGPRLFQGAEVVGFKHPPRGLALGSVLANEHGCSLEGKPHDTSLGSRCLRRFLDKDAATLR